MTMLPSGMVQLAGQGHQQQLLGHLAPQQAQQAHQPHQLSQQPVGISAGYAQAPQPLPEVRIPLGGAALAAAIPVAAAGQAAPQQQLYVAPGMMPTPGVVLPVTNPAFAMGAWAMQMQQAHLQHLTQQQQQQLLQQQPPAPQAQQPLPQQQQPLVYVYAPAAPPPGPKPPSVATPAPPNGFHSQAAAAVAGTVQSHSVAAGAAL
ncbi:hypothetical protein MNEG_0290 [Monoraphidium neglectum]|uniref:Uncharacterized protein n=1 Tax=Monoraphidium neglectum TaxID=145388 RepID=A0A0D2NUA6_9CHLO|nr:hypothetical protein MNEG_0290 [Monoraphidium neglectum]KIZ07651.1 hypothetical protein MNEG_0290 [Monoraphidium neglectum]|eukprot:XP_013906670.1 hypothetical protein MNEG_0290 [Monoraphidium neglectum]